MRAVPIGLDTVCVTRRRAVTPQAFSIVNDCSGLMRPVRGYARALPWSLFTTAVPVEIGVLRMARVVSGRLRAIYPIASTIKRRPLR